MIDFNFDIPERFDATVADEGVWFEVVDEREQSWGKFKLAHADLDGSRIKKAQQRAKVKYAKEIRTKTLDDNKLAVDVFLEAVLLDWEMKGRDGKPVKFTPEATRAYFEKPAVRSFALPKLLEYSSDVLNFGREDKEEVAKNS